MLINIGGLWESPITIADERPISPPDYSEINNYESERTTFGSYNKELYTIAGGHDVTDFIYFKNASPQECNQDETHLQCDVVNSSGTFHEKIIKACYGYMDVNQIPPNKESDIALGKHEQIGLSPNSQRENRGIKFRHDINAGSAKHISGHASKSLLVRSSKAKDRYSKINTAKGLRDRRVRLSVSTAIQFYNLQHKLGFDQPSKALDWLMSKAKSAIDELPRPSSISKLNCLSSNSATSLTDIVPTSGVPERVSHSVPRSLTCPVEKTENKMGSTAACIEERKWEDLKVGAKNVVLPMPQDCTEASSHVEICSERKRCQPSVPQKKGNKEKEITLTSPFGKQSSGCEIGFSCDPNNIIACLEPFSSLCIPSGQDGTDGQEMHGPPFVVYSSYFELWPDAGETGNLSEKCMSPLVFSLQESDSAYVEAALRHSGMLNGNQNRGVPQNSSSTTDSTDGANGSRNGFDRLNLQHGIKAFYFEQDQ